MTLSVCVVIVGFRYLRNRESLAMLEKGLDPNIKPLKPLKSERPRPAPFRSLKWGLLIVGAGLGLLIAYLMDNTVLYRIGHTVNHWNGDYEVNGANVSLYFAFIAIGGGLGLIGSYLVEKKELLDKEEK